jgi:hypothetical protein
MSRQPRGTAAAEAARRVAAVMAIAADDTTTTPDDSTATAQVDDLAEVDTTQPLDQRPIGTALTPAQLSEGVALADATNRAVKLARNAEHNRFAAAYTADVNAAGVLIELLIEVIDQHGSHELADPATIHKLRIHLDSWVGQRGLNGDRAEGGGS